MVPKLSGQEGEQSFVEESIHRKSKQKLTFCALLVLDVFQHGPSISQYFYNTYTDVKFAKKPSIRTAQKRFSLVLNVLFYSVHVISEILYLNPKGGVPIIAWHVSTYTQNGFCF